MADNFDTNVARRKPNTARTAKPVHPWHVAPENNVSGNIPETAPDVPAIPSPDNEKIAPKEAVYSPPEPVSTPKASPEPVKAVSKNDLSNKINIYSHYCKLENNVSDWLFPRLSASAQSVYLRLYRQSYGWSRNWASESLPKLSKACNLSLQTIRKAIKELEAIFAIRKEFSDYHKATVYRVYLPSEIISADTAMSSTAGLISDTPKQSSQELTEKSHASNTITQNSAGFGIHDGGVKNIEGNSSNIRGQESVIQSVYFAGTSIYNILETGGPLSKDIRKYITDIYTREAVAIIDEFYESIGFSIVSRSLYRKSMLDYFEVIDSGFSPDDIRYAVRWTFQNSRSRPESFSLIKHTMHLAMDTLINELKSVSGEKDLVKQKQDALEKNTANNDMAGKNVVSGADMEQWLKVFELLKNDINERSFAAFIEPLKLSSADESKIVIDAPRDSVSWIQDHYHETIEAVYKEVLGREITVLIG